VVKVVPPSEFLDAKPVPLPVDANGSAIVSEHDFNLFLVDLFNYAQGLYEDMQGIKKFVEDNNESIK